MKQCQLLQTLQTVADKPINNASVLVTAYLCEWFGQFENSIIGKLLTLQAVALVSAQATGNGMLVKHLSYQLAQLWATMFPVEGAL